MGEASSRASFAARCRRSESLSEERLERALSRIADPAGEGRRTFTKVYSGSLHPQAVHSPIAGSYLSVKDLFDVAGDVTRAGSRVLADAPPATRDAVAVARLRAAGAVIIGRTNMVEFAFGVVGANPHYGTPANPFDRATRRVPGGSSSGAAVAVADGMCDIALGTDTRGSIRVPAALCGIVGFKPTARRVPRDGVFPLSYTLDSVGPLAKTVADCAACDAVLAGERDVSLASLAPRDLRLMVPQSSVLDDLDASVAAAFANATTRLSRAGARLIDVPMPMFDRQDEYFRGGGFAGAEAYAIHKPRLDRLDEYDPRVGKRIVLGEQVTLDAYARLVELRAEFIRDVEAAAAGFNAILMPTTPCTAPTIAEATESDEAYFRWNSRILRNAGLVNFLDGCAVSLPCHDPGTAPVGLSVCGVAMSDRHTLAVAAAIESVLAP